MPPESETASAPSHDTLREDRAMNNTKNRWLALLLLLSMVAMVLPALAEEEPDPDDECPDAWITTKIGTKLTFKGMAKLDVSTEECVVTIRGCVKTEDKRNEAIEAAENTKYVKQVVNKIELCPEDDDG
jgi:hypothetical protein